MDVNDGLHRLNERGAVETIASELPQGMPVNNNKTRK